MIKYETRSFSPFFKCFLLCILTLKALITDLLGKSNQYTNRMGSKSTNSGTTQKHGNWNVKMTDPIRLLNSGKSNFFNTPTIICEHKIKYKCYTILLVYLSNTSLQLIAKHDTKFRESCKHLLEKIKTITIW